MVLTNNQQSCIERARRYRKSTMQTKPFRKLYIDFCRDGHIDADMFISLVTGNDVNVLPFNQPIKEKSIRDYISKFESDVLGKTFSKREER